MFSFYLAVLFEKTKGSKYYLENNWFHLQLVFSKHCVFSYFCHFKIPYVLSSLPSIQIFKHAK